jgi:hypothetical protein
MDVFRTRTLTDADGADILIRGEEKLLSRGIAPWRGGS